MRIELVIIGIIVIIVGGALFFYGSGSLLGNPYYPNGLAGGIIGLIGFVCLLVGSMMPNSSAQGIEEQTLTEYSSISYVEGHPKFKGKNLIQLVFKSKSVFFQTVMGSEYPIDLDIPFQSISKVSSENRQIMIDCIGSGGQNHHIILEAEGAGVYKMPQLIKQLNSVVPKSGANAQAQSTINHMDVLKLRYAKGEISKEQYEEMKKTLEN